MSAESLEQPRPDPPGGGSDGPVDGAPDHTVVTVGVIAVPAVVAWAALGHHALHGMRDAVRAMVGDALTEQGPDHHPRLRRVAESKGRGRGDGPDGPGA
ncbi:hypothetical protein AB0O22_16795 [Streptomyces sp. NPDC091204]|uniref:hypothetical protein n=1 Tax=Streptomyces sp. NPDC091204 TaxID=3155299 RepID=UPI00342EB723